MIRKIEGLGFIAILIVAMSMGVASAYALPTEATQLHATTANGASVFGEQEGQNVFTTDSGTVKCTQSLFEGALAPSGGEQSTQRRSSRSQPHTQAAPPLASPRRST